MSPRKADGRPIQSSGAPGRRVRPRGGRGAGTLLVMLVAAVALLPGGAWAAGEDPVAEVAAALRSLGPPGVLWGRFAIEEESPAGAWTPLAGVEVTLYPATPTLVAELERIRQSARTSGAQYESAVARVLAALAVHQARVVGENPPAPPAAEDSAPAGPPIPVPSKAPPKATPAPAPGARPAGPGGETPAAESPEAVAARPRWRQRTDPAGLFAFDDLPSGDWLLVATRVTAYGAEKLRGEPKARSTAVRGQQRFTPRSATPAKEAEVWVVRARVGAAERVGLELSDRARWLVGPLR
jgi:hypothetical protein